MDPSWGSFYMFLSPDVSVAHLGEDQWPAKQRWIGRGRVVDMDFWKEAPGSTIRTESYMWKSILKIDR